MLFESRRILRLEIPFFAIFDPQKKNTILGDFRVAAATLPQRIVFGFFFLLSDAVERLNGRKINTQKGRGEEAKSAIAK